LNDTPENHEETLQPSVSREDAPDQNSTVRQSFKVRDPADRPARKQKSIYQKVIPPLLGGLAAFPLATAILWYGFGRDIGGLGPSVARYVPWIVPRALRGSSFRADGTFGGSNPHSDRPSPIRNSTAPSSSEGVKSSLPSIGSSRSKATTNANNKVSNTAVSPPTDFNNESPSEAPLVSTPATAELKSSSSASPPPDSKAELESNANPVQPPKATKDLAQWVERLEELQAQWATIPREREAQLKAVADFYQCLCKIAESIDVNESAISEYWHQQRGNIGKTILQDAKFSALVKRSATGEIPNQILLKAGAYGATILAVKSSHTDDDVHQSEVNLKVDAVIANQPCLIHVAKDNKPLISRLQNIDLNSEYLILFRVDEHEDGCRLVAIDFISAN